jgi:hypothetical protein
MSMRRILVLLPLLATPSAGALSGQVCFRGRPEPECGSFFITEIGFAIRLTQEPLDEGLVSADLGYMVNLSDDWAVGGTLYAAFEDFTDPMPDARVGAKARIRRWFKPWLSFDVAPGIMRYNGGQGGEELALTSQFSLSFRDQLVLTTQFDYLHYKGNKVLAWYAGLRFGSQPAVAVALLSVLIAGVAASAPSY